MSTAGFHTDSELPAYPRRPPTSFLIAHPPRQSAAQYKDVMETCKPAAQLAFPVRVSGSGCWAMGEAWAHLALLLRPGWCKWVLTCWEFFSQGQTGVFVSPDHRSRLSCTSMRTVINTAGLVRFWIAETSRKYRICPWHTIDISKEWWNLHEEK